MSYEQVDLTDYERITRVSEGFCPNCQPPHRLRVLSIDDLSIEDLPLGMTHMGCCDNYGTYHAARSARTSQL